VATVTVALVPHALNQVQIASVNGTTSSSCEIEVAKSPGVNVLGLADFPTNKGQLKGVTKGATYRVAPNMFLAQAGSGSHLTLLCNVSVTVAWASSLLK